MSSEFDLAFFHDNGFHRQICPKCGRAFWSQGLHPSCGESPCEEYSFINNSPIKRAYSNHEMREEYLSFFEENGHGRVGRYPIVARLSLASTTPVSKTMQTVVVPFIVSLCSAIMDPGNK